MESSQPLSDAVFPETQWTLIEALSSAGHPHREEAMQSLMQRYWPPVYAYLRRLGHSSEDAADLTQQFFLDKILSQDLFGRADMNRGRLRSLLMRSIANFAVTARRRHSKTIAIQSMDLFAIAQEDRLPWTHSQQHEPGDVFDRRWALAVLHESLRRAERQFQLGERRRWWQAYELRVVQPALNALEPVAYAAIAERAGFASAEDARSSVRQVNRRILMIMKQVVAETTADPAEQEQEFQDVVALLQH